MRRTVFCRLIRHTASNPVGAHVVSMIGAPLRRALMKGACAAQTLLASLVSTEASAVDLSSMAEEAMKEDGATARAPLLDHGQNVVNPDHPESVETKILHQKGSA